MQVFLYEGPEKFGKLHAKEILVDDSFVSIGICNMDKWALYHNFEQNIQSEDLVFAQQAPERIFNYAIAYSGPYVPQAEEKRRSRIPSVPLEKPFVSAQNKM